MTKSRTLRKAGAVVLSLAMAFSVAGVAPSADAAAKKPALSAKKGTITVGKKKAVKVKNTTAKKVKKLVVSSNKTAVATVKKNSKVKFTVTGKKAGTAKITAKVTLKKAVAKKKVYKLKYTATVKKAATTPTEAPAVAVTSVTLSNTAPKVGDTETATVEPANATNLTYAWYVIDSATAEVAADAVPVSTTSSYTVAAGDAGKFIRVNVTGENGSSASATTTKAVEASPTEKIAISSAKQTGASKIAIAFNKAVTTSEYDITLAKGTAKQDVTVVLDDTNMAGTITTGVALSSGEYTVTVTKKTDATETASSAVTCEKAELKKIDFLGNELILTSSDFTAASVVVKGFNQFEEEVALSGSLKPYATKGEPKYDPKTSKINVNAVGGVLFQVGEKITVTAVYQSGTNVIQVAKELAISNVATLTKFEVGELATTKADLKGKKVTVANFSTGTYYLPVKVAKDQYGNDLSAADLEKMRDTAKGGNLYVTPNSKTGSYAYVTGFEKLADGTLAMKLGAGDIGKPGKAIISVTGVAGFQGTFSVEIVDNPYIAKLTVEAPNLYSKIPATLSVSAVDEYGEAVNIYDAVKDTTVTGGKFTFNDTNTLTGGHSSIQVAATGKLEVTKDTAKKSVTFKYTPDGAAGATARSAASDDIITVQTATPAVENLSWRVETLPTPAGIKGLAGGVATTVKKSQANFATLSQATVQILDNNNAIIDYSGTHAIKDVYFVNAKSDIAADKYFAVVTSDKPTVVSVNNESGDPSALTLTSGSTSGTAKITIELFKGTGSGTGESLGSKDFTFAVSEGTYASYKAKLAAGSELLYVGATSKDFTNFTVLGVDGAGAELPLEDGYTVTVTDGLDVTNGGKSVSGCAKGISAKGTATATIWASVKGAPKSVVATVDVPYDVAASAPQKAVQLKAGAGQPMSKAGSTTDTTWSEITDAYLNADGVMQLSTAANEYYLYIVDQYNMAMPSTKWAINGDAFKTESNKVCKSAALTATNLKVTGSWSISGVSTDSDELDCYKDAADAKVTVASGTIGASATEEIATVSAVKDGNVWAMTAAKYADYKTNNFTEPVAGTDVINLGSLLAGETQTLSEDTTSGWKAGTTYYIVLTDDTTQVTFATRATATAIATTISGAFTSSTDNVASGEILALNGLTVKDQYGNKMTSADADGLATTVTTTTATDITNATIGWNADGAVTITPTFSNKSTLGTETIALSTSATSDVEGNLGVTFAAGSSSGVKASNASWVTA